MARTTKIVYRPSDGQAVTVRQLSWLQIRASRQLSQAESARNLITMGGAEFARAYREMARAERDAEAEAREREAQMTPGTRPAPPGAPSDAPGGGEPPDAPAPALAPVAPPEEAPEPDLLRGHDLFTVLVGGLPDYTRAQVEDLTEEDAEYLGREILRLTPRRTAADQGNAPAPSIAV